MERIGFLGGAFDPPHLGHVAIVDYILGLVDRVWVVPCAAHAYGKSMAPFANRLAMCRIAFTQPQVTVSDCESTLPAPNYTINTIQYLQKKHPAQYFIIVGADQDVSNWKDAAELVKLAPLLTVPRGTDPAIPNVSSTEVRQALQHQQDTSLLIPTGVCEYIQQHQLYK